MDVPALSNDALIEQMLTAYSWEDGAHSGKQAKAWGNRFKECRKELERRMQK
jgi:hypothetical protein